jgi:hypothetical protein
MTEQGYYQTPNKFIPLNDREPGEIADVAKLQLIEWESAVEDWAIALVFRDERWCNICAKCEQNVWFERDKNGIEYRYEPSEILALIVAHVRQNHAEEFNGTE